MQSTTVCNPMESWTVLLKEQHEGDISGDEQVQNQQVLANTRTNPQALPRAAREGLALRQGLLVCAQCARRGTVRYPSTGGISPSYPGARAKLDGASTTPCLSVRSQEMDAAISQRGLEAIRPAQLEIALPASAELAPRQTTVDRQWRLKIERAAYEAQLAPRRYEAVDPANRLVAATLEQRWNAALEQVAVRTTASTHHQQEQNSGELLPHREEVLALGKDRPRLWRARTTTAKDRNRILRLLLKDITLARAEKPVRWQIRWQGGAVEELLLPLRPKSCDQWRHAPELVHRRRELARELSDEQLVQTLNQEGVKTNKGHAFTLSGIRWIRHPHAIPAANLKRAEELTVQEVAAKFRVSSHVVSYWISRHHVRARKPTSQSGAPWFLTIDSENEQRLHQWVTHSSRIAKVPKSQSSIEGEAL